MINIKTLLTNLNDLKNRAIAISTRFSTIAAIGESTAPKVIYVPYDADEFNWWGKIKFLFNGSRRVTQLIGVITFIFDIVELDLYELENAQTDLIDAAAAYGLDCIHPDNTIDVDVIEVER